MGVRTRAIQRRLQSVEALSAVDARKILPSLANEDEIEENNTL